MHDRIIKPYGDPDLKLEGLSLWVLEGEDPESDHWSDGNWLTVFARVEASGAYVWVHGPCLTSDELAGFLEQLERIDRDLRGSALLDCAEPYIRAQVAFCGPLGQTEVTIQITPDHLAQTHQFRFASDQTHVALAIRGCRAILAKFPVRSSARR